MEKQYQNKRPRKCCSCEFFESYDNNHTKGLCHFNDKIIRDARLTFICPEHRILGVAQCN